MSKTFCYSIHDLITVESDVRLRELAYFMVDTLPGPPMIRVQLGSISGAPSKPVGPMGPSADHIVYSEALGNLGFKAEIWRGDRIEMVISPVLRWSPHVLYTNLVEPVLRWTFASIGYALVHAACLVFDDGAYLITARTDTGKTSTVLHCLVAQRSTAGVSSCAAFISDDLTLLHPDGTVLAYPKPLTISHHTTKVVPTEVLTLRQRLSLAVQGRVHSRLSRRMALRLAYTRLPMATINTLVQLTVPPPKYHIQQLVPGVNIATKASVAGLFVIKRGPEGRQRLGDDTVLGTLMANSEDAYGFPPYQVLAPFMSQNHGRDLRTAEREIVARALRGLPAMLLQSNQMDWWRSILSLTSYGVATAALDLNPLQEAGASTASA